ncbi:hypothetical protein ACEPAG_2010 [Sanghuangporus baumii]
MLSSSSPSRKPSFRSTKTTSTAQLSPLQRSRSSRDIATLASISSHPSPSSPGKTRGRRTVPANYSSPTKATKSSPKLPSSSLTRSTVVRPPSPHPSNSNSKYLYANSRIPTPTPTPSSDSKPRSPQPPNTHRRTHSDHSPIPRRNSGSGPSNPIRRSYMELLTILPMFSSSSSSVLTSATSSHLSPPRTTSSPSSLGIGVGLGSPADASSPSPTSLHTRPRVPSRTQLRHASAARRLSAEGLRPIVRPAPAPLGKDESILPDDPRDISNVPTTTAITTTAIPSSDSHPAPNKDLHEDSKKGVSFESWTGLRSRSHLHSRSDSNSTSKELHLRNLGEDYHGRKRKQLDTAPDVSSTPPPYLPKTLEFAEVGLVAESANMETLMGNREILGASFMTPQSILDKMDDSDNYYHVWVAVKLALEEVSYQEHGLEAVAKLAFTKLVSTSFHYIPEHKAISLMDAIRFQLIELGVALNGCLNRDVPHYTFVDPRRLMDPQGMDIILDQAVEIIEGLEKKGLSKDRIYISIPATETGLAIAKKLKEKHGIKTNLTLVSNLVQAAACAEAGAAVITMPVDKILTVHELHNCLEYDEMSPHPGWQAIKSTACYMKYHRLETRVIGSGWRSFEELEHCSSFSAICLSDKQVVPARWHRMRINRPPGPSSHIASLAHSTPYPPSKFRHDERGFRYISHIESSEARNQCAGILYAGMKNWQDAAERLQNVICREIERQLYLWIKSPSVKEGVQWGDDETEPPLSPRTSMMVDVEQYERSRFSRSQSVQRWGESASAFTSAAAAAVANGRYVEVRKQTQKKVQDQDKDQQVQIEFPRKEKHSTLSSEWDEWDDEELDERVLLYERGDSLDPFTSNTGSVPSSPCWTDADTFENETEHENGSSSSSSSDDGNDMILIV